LLFQKTQPPSQGNGSVGTSSFCGVIKQPRKKIVRQHCQECRDSRNCNRACTHGRVRKKTTMMINIDSCNNARTIIMQSREFSPFASVSKRNETSTNMKYLLSRVGIPFFNLRCSIPAGQTVSWPDLVSSFSFLAISYHRLHI